MSFHEGCLSRPTRDGGISAAAARELHRSGEGVSAQFDDGGEARLVFDEGERLEVRFFDAEQRLVRQHRFIRVERSKLLLDWAEEREYDPATGGVVRDRSWRIFPSGDIFVAASDRERRTSGEAELENQPLAPFMLAAPGFGDYAALIAFRPALPAPPLRWRETGM